MYWRFVIIPLQYPHFPAQAKVLNIHVPERVDCVKALFEFGSYDAQSHEDLSVRNLVERYNDLVEVFPDSLRGEMLPYFVDWLIDNVDLVEIETFTDDDAFTIFETMNDRGLHLGLSDMLKGYLLANIDSSDEQIAQDKKIQANRIWKQRMLELLAIASEEDVTFFKTWLRARYADTIRERKGGAINRDFENINKYHRWIRDERKRIGLATTEDFYNFITMKMRRYSDYYLTMRRAAFTLTAGMEAIYYNANHDFTLQYMMALAPIVEQDDKDTAERKIRLVTTFIDIFLARRIVNFNTIGYNTLQYTAFTLTKAIRDMDALTLRDYLRNYLDNMAQTFQAVHNFYLHPQNYNKTRHLLARLTTHIEQQSGINTTFDTYIRREQSKPFEIEHIWAEKYERHADEFRSEDEFLTYRNRFGGLILLRRGTNQSFGATAYDEKLSHYIRENLLVASLNEAFYKSNPNFINYVKQTGMPFKPHNLFKKADLDARQELYRQLCEEIWSPARFDVILGDEGVNI